MAFERLLTIEVGGGWGQICNHYVASVRAESATRSPRMVLRNEKRKVCVSGQLKTSLDQFWEKTVFQAGNSDDCSVTNCWNKKLPEEKYPKKFNLKSHVL